jgi:hypothetical protein
VFELREAVSRCLAVLAVAGAATSLSVATAGASGSTPPAGEVSILAEPVPCAFRDDFFKIRYDVSRRGDFVTQCWANPGWVANGGSFLTYSMCAGDNIIDYDIGNIRTTLFKWDCRTITAGAEVSRIYMR